MRKLSVKSNL